MLVYILEESIFFVDVIKIEKIYLFSKKLMKVIKLG